MLAAIPTPAFLIATTLLIFGAVVILRWIVGLKGATSDLRDRVRKASETLARGSDEIAAGAGQALRARDAIRARREGRRR